MAGIGFELKRIFAKKTLFSSLSGVLYSAFTTIGSSLMFTVLLFVIQVIIRHSDVTELESLFFTSSFTYAFLIAILVSSLLSTIISRYISDKIFEQKESDISASLYGALCMGTVIAGLVATILCIFMYKDNIPMYFLATYYFLVIMAVDSYILLAYISALKEYKKIALSYLCGIIVVILLVFILQKCFAFNLIFALYLALDVGFFITNFMLVYYCLKAFGSKVENCFEFLSYYKKYPVLMLNGCFYILGFYVSNIIYWFFSDMQATVSIFKIAPNYDWALFLATLINMSSLVIFEIKTETNFYDKYVAYLSVINKGTYEQIENERLSMQNTINLQLFFVYEIQLIITIISICVINVLHTYLGIGEQVLQTFMILGMALYCVFSMYFTMIFLYYFSDYKSALFASSSFLVTVVLGSFVCCYWGSPYYPLPILIGGIVGWLVSFVKLRRRLKNLNKFLMCR